MKIEKLYWNTKQAFALLVLLFSFFRSQFRNIKEQNEQCMTTAMTMAIATHIKYKVINRNETTTKYTKILCNKKERKREKKKEQQQQ